MSEVLIMNEQTLPDPEEMLAGVMERQQEMFEAGRKAALEALQVYSQTANAFGDSQDKLADASEVEWLSRLLRAQATFTRDVLDASEKFTRDVMQE
jgi:hypothetical protein